MKKLAALHFVAAWLVIAVVLGFIPAPVHAYIYDDFDGTGIDTNLWSDRGPIFGLFTQPGDGYLHFYDDTGGLGYYQILRSTSRQTTPFFVSMQYTDYQVINDDTRDWTGSGPILWIGDANNSVRLYEYINASGIPQGFRAIKVVKVGEEIQKTGLGPIIGTGASSASLGINYDGTYVSFWYDVGSGWQEMPLFEQYASGYAPGFADDPYFCIEGWNEYGTYLSFKVDQVNFDPVPLPPAVLLLGSGLLGLAGLGRRIKQR